MLGLCHVDPTHDIYLYIVEIDRLVLILLLLLIGALLDQGSLLLFQRLLDT